jgi:hypothetical protein
MAHCQFCHSEMTTARSCTVEALHLGGTRYELAPHGSDPFLARFPRGRCGDCGVAWGGLHHLGCDLQRCPRCRGQLLSCGCRFDEDSLLGLDADDDDDDDTEGEIAWDAPPELGMDRYGNITEHGTVGGLELVVHYGGDYPETDITTVDGVRCTTPIRTFIDVAPEMDPDDLRESVMDAIERGLFTQAEAWERVACSDMTTHVGAELLRRTLRSLG